MILGALRSALSAKLADEKLTVVDGWQLDSHKTKPFRAGARQARRRDANDSAGRSRRERESGTRQPQSGRRDAGAAERAAALRLAAARPPDAFARSGGAAEPRAFDGQSREAPVQIEPAPAAPAKKAAQRPRAPRKSGSAKTASKTAKKPAAAKKEKPKCKAEGEKGISRWRPGSIK